MYVSVLFQTMRNAFNKRHQQNLNGLGMSWLMIPQIKLIKVAAYTTINTLPTLVGSLSSVQCNCTGHSSSHMCIGIILPTIRCFHLTYFGTSDIYDISMQPLTRKNCPYLCSLQLFGKNHPLLRPDPIPQKLWGITQQAVG